MARKTQERKIKCPHCGWVRTMTVEGGAADTFVVRGLGEAIKDTADRIRDLLNDARLDDANAWIDMPACPNSTCQKVYRYNVRTGKASP